MSNSTDDKILFLDLETTGVDPLKHMITQIAAEYHVNGNIVDKFNIYLQAVPQQGTAISLGALKITKQTLASVMAPPPRPDEPNAGFRTTEAEGLMKFLDWLIGLDTKAMFICGHNVAFDISFLKIALARYNIEQWDQVVSYKVEDTCSLARSMQKAGLVSQGSVSLGTLANDLGISPPKGEHLHDAATDVRVTAKVYYKLIKILQRLAEGQMV